MKMIMLAIATAATLTACQSSTTSESRWRDMWVDIALRHKYERYSCGYHAQEGFSKDGPAPQRIARRGRGGSESVKESPVPSRPAEPPGVTAQQAYNAVQELSAKIEVLEDALKSNVAATNQNQGLIVDQIKELKARLAELQQAKPTLPLATGSPSGIRIPQN
jgi:hypothetical protein